MDAVVPLWMRCVPLAVALLYAPVTYWWLRAPLSFALRSYRKALREEPTLHWTERARLSLGPRTFASVMLFALPAQAALLANGSAGSLSLADGATITIIAALTSFAGAYAGLRRLGEQLGLARASLLYDLRATIFSLHGVLLYAAAALGFTQIGQVAAALVNGNPVGERHIIQLCFGVLALSILWGRVQTLLFRTFGLYREDARVVKSLAPVFETTRVRPREFWVVRTSVANAFSYPLRNTIAVTERLLEILTPAELGAVVAHELGHLKEGNQAWWRLAMLWFVCGVGFTHPFVDSESMPLFWGAALVAFFLVARLMRPLSRRREHAADSVAVEASDAAVYARALEKIYEVNLYPATQRGGTHPSLYDRLERAGITPTYPRPALPSRKLGWSGVVALVTFPLLTVAWPQVWLSVAGPGSAVAAVVTKDAHPISTLAYSAWVRGDTATAIALYRRAEELDAHSPWYPRNLAAVLDQVGDCQGARAAADRAHEKANANPEVDPQLFIIECAE